MIVVVNVDDDEIKNKKTITQALRDGVLLGIGLHNADLTFDEREAVSIYYYFKKNKNDNCEKQLD